MNFTIFSNRHTGIIFCILVIFWVIFEVGILHFKKSKSFSSKFNSYILFISFFIFFGSTFILKFFDIGYLRNNLLFISISGFIFFLLGFLLRVLAVITLGRWFTRNPTIQPNQILIQRGVYKLMRHPSYTGGILIYLGLSLLLMNWILAIYSLIWFFVIYSWRIKEEEEMLIEKFGNTYRIYQEYTKKMIPFIY